MKLETIHFDAYKSLLGADLHMTYPCMGMVGINESGKSNVLRALECLSRRTPLGPRDIPKMSNTSDPALRFVFSLDDADISGLMDLVQNAAEPSGTLKHPLTPASATVTYHVQYSKAQEKERRFFTIDGVALPPKTYVRKLDALIDGCVLRLNNSVVPLENILFVSQSDLQANEALITASAKLDRLRDDASKLRQEIKQLASSEEAKPSADASGEPEPPSENADSGDHTESRRPATQDSPRVHKLKSKLSTLTTEIESLETELGEFDILGTTHSLEDKLRSLKHDIARHEESRNSASKELAAMEAQSDPSEENKKQMSTLKRSITTSQNTQVTIQQELGAIRHRLAAAQEPLDNKFTDDVGALAAHLGHLANAELEGRLPDVVFWTYSDDYILQGETEFAEIIQAKTLADISRPLVNLFRIGLNVDSFDSLLRTVKQIQQDPSERSRHQDTLNRKIRTYLKSVWPDYDQEIRIFLEKERIRVQFVDPSHTDASYYEMQERSQGCQTFISFLLTIGAEAKHGIIANTVLLLDEPETHLHPSGVRYMLHELIKAADNGNTVLFATHSIFMIDMNCYERHLMIRKEHERTQILPSKKDRIGYFMQEEVLYGAIDIDLETSLPTRNRLNFVLEGDGDVILFDAFYNRALRDADRPLPLNKTSLYQGGKCSDIKRYFRQKPIQLGSKWVFILDDDDAANDLAAFIEKRYRDYIGIDIFVYRYTRDDEPVEFEDLLPLSTVKAALSDAANENGLTVDPERITDDESFRQCFAAIVKAADGTDQLKSSFKEHLNRTIADRVDSLKNHEGFKEYASEYTAWASHLVEDLRSKSVGGKAS